MKTKVQRVAGLLLAVAAMPGAGSRSGAATAQSPSAAPVAERMYRASKIVGSSVRDGHGQRIGEVKDLILGSARGDVAYAVLSFGSVLGIGDRYQAVPWKALQPSDDGTYYILQADRETISRAPGFDRTKWPELSDRGWRTEVDNYWARMVGHGTADVNRLSSGVSGSNSGPAPAAPPSSGSAAGSGRSAAGH